MPHCSRIAISRSYFSIHRVCWKAAVTLMDYNYDEFNIPYEGTTLAGFFISHKG